MPYEIWMICDVCKERMAVPAETLADLSFFALEIAKRSRSYVDLGGEANDRPRVNCPPCSIGVRGVDGDGNVYVPKAPGGKQ